MAQPTLADLQRDIQDLVAKTGSKAFDAVSISAMNLEQAKDAVKLLSAELREMSTDLDYINKSFKDTLNELSKQNVYLNTAKNSLRGVSSIASQILEHKKGESTLDTSQLTKLKQKAKLQFEEIQLAIKAGNLSTIERDALEESLEARKDFNRELDRTIAIEKQVNKEIGLAGVGLKGFANLMSKAGLGDLSKPFADAIDKTKDARRQLQFYGDAINELESKSNRTKEEEDILASHRAQVVELSKQTSKYKNIVSELGKQFTMVNLVDAAIGKIVTEYFNVNKAAVEYTRLTGQNATVTAGLNDSLATSAQVLELTADLTKQTGLASGAIFSPDDLGRLAEAKNLLGLSSEQAGNLGLRSKVVGKSIDDYQEGIVKSTNSFNKLNNTAVSHGLVMQDVLSVSDDIALSMGNSDKVISKAAASARSLGLSLEKVDQIAGSIINFEDSIGNELEAQLLTGKNINLAKAREFALSNDLAGLSEELKKNGASAAEFAKMGRIEQESLAKALGMSRSELAKMIMLDETAKNLTDKERAAAMGVKEEQMKQMDIQAKMEQSLAKLAQAFAPILDAMVPIVEVLMAALKPVAFIVAGIASGFNYIVESVKSLVGFLTGGNEQLTFMQSIVGSIAGLYLLIKSYALATQVIEGVKLGIKAQQSILDQKALFTANKGITKAIGMAVMNTIAGFAKLGPIGIALGLAAVGGIVAMGAKYTMDDGVIGPGGAPIVSGPKGSIQLNKDDSMIVGTDLFSNKKSTQDTSQTITPSLSIEPLVQELRGLRTEMLSLIQVVKEGGDVYMDSNKIGKAMVLGTYKSS